MLVRPTDFIAYADMHEFVKIRREFGRQHLLVCSRKVDPQFEQRLHLFISAFCGTEITIWYFLGSASKHCARDVFCGLCTL
jgi:hypothetical protein